MSKLTRRIFGKYHNTFFYADYGDAFIVWLFVIVMIFAIAYLLVVEP